MSGCSEQEVLETLRELGQAEVATLAKLLDSHPITIERHCYDLYEEGYILQVSGGVYMITSEGELYAESLNR